MLISRSHRFIFIHVVKTAGTSIIRALMPYAASKPRRIMQRTLGRFGVNLYPKPFGDHVTASDVIRKMGKENFEAYFSFAVVRNPWDWQASLYSYILKEVSHYQHRLVKRFRGFDEYIEWRCSQEAGYQKDFIVDESGAQLVDFVARFENLEADFQYICARLGISATLPRLNVSKTKPYQEFYSDKSVALVRENFAPDIQLFGYEFPENGKHRDFSAKSL